MDYGRVQQLVTGRKSKIEDGNQKELVDFHKLPAELQASRVVTAKKNSLKWKEKHDARVSRQQEVKIQRRDMVLRKKMETSKEEYIVAMYFLGNITQRDAGILWPEQEINTKLSKVKPGS